MTDAPLDETRAIRGLMAEAKVHAPQLAAALHVNPETVRRRLRKPGEWNIGSLSVIAPVLNTTVEEIIRRARGAA